MDGSVAGMDENRWPRPGPGMVVMFAVVGLIAGILTGLFNPAGSRQDPGQGLSQRTDAPATTRSDALPERFYTVVLASVARSRDRSEAEARAEEFRGEGIQDVGVLDPERYASLSDGFWAVFSGVFETQGEAADHRDELRASYRNLANAYLKTVNNDS
jgi:hypothetical protein